MNALLVENAFLLGIQNLCGVFPKQNNSCLKCHFPKWAEILGHPWEAYVWGIITVFFLFLFSPIQNDWHVSRPSHIKSVLLNNCYWMCIDWITVAFTALLVYSVIPSSPSLETKVIPF